MAKSARSVKADKSQQPTDPPVDFQGIKAFQFEIRGIAPLLQHRFTEQAELPGRARKIHIREQDPRTIAENNCYRTAEGALYHPGPALMRMLREAGASHKERSSRRSMKYIIPACVMVLDDIIPLLNSDGKQATEFEVDARPVVIPSTKGRIMCYRPRLNAWRMVVNIEIDTAMIDAELVHQLITEGGRRIGIGDYRPEKGGPFGRFQMERWAEVA